MPDPGFPLEPKLVLELQILGEVVGKSTGKTIGVHDRAPAGTGNTQCSNRSSSTLRYTLVDSELACPKTAAIVGKATAACNIFEAALCRSNWVPALTPVIPALRKVLSITV